MQMRGRRSEKCRLVLVSPDFLDAHAASVQTATAGTRIVGDRPAVEGPLQNERKDLPSVVRLPSRCERELVAPFHEEAARATI